MLMPNAYGMTPEQHARSYRTGYPQHARLWALLGQEDAIFRSGYDEGHWAEVIRLLTEEDAENG